MALALPHGIEPGGMNQEDLYKLLVNVLAELNEVKLDYTALRVDVGAIRTQVIASIADATAIRAEVVKLVTDMATRISNHNTLATKLNADGGVADTNYAAAGAATAANPAAIGAADPAALTSTTIAAGDATLNQG